jgi:hypothetical protein
VPTSARHGPPWDVPPTGFLPHPTISMRTFPRSSLPLDLDSLLDVALVDIPPLPLPLVSTTSSAPCATQSPLPVPHAALPLRPSSTRFSGTTRVYQRCVRSDPQVHSSDESLRALARSHDEPPVHHPVAIHRNPATSTQWSHAISRCSPTNRSFGAHDHRHSASLACPLIHL